MLVRINNGHSVEIDGTANMPVTMHPDGRIVIGEARVVCSESINNLEAAVAQMDRAFRQFTNVSSGTN